MSPSGRPSRISSICLQWLPWAITNSQILRSSSQEKSSLLILGLRQLRQRYRICLDVNSKQLERLLDILELISFHFSPQREMRSRTRSSSSLDQFLSLVLIKILLYLLQHMFCVLPQKYLGISFHSNFSFSTNLYSNLSSSNVQCVFLWWVSSQWNFYNFSTSFCLSISLEMVQVQISREEGIVGSGWSFGGGRQFSGENPYWMGWRKAGKSPKGLKQFEKFIIIISVSPSKFEKNEMIKSTLLLTFSIAFGLMTVQPRSSFGTKLTHVDIFSFSFLLLFLMPSKAPSGICQDLFSQLISQLNKPLFSPYPGPAHEFCSLESKTVASF